MYDVIFPLLLNYFKYFFSRISLSSSLVLPAYQAFIWFHKGTRSMLLGSSKRHRYQRNRQERDKILVSCQVTGAVESISSLDSILHRYGFTIFKITVNRNSAYLNIQNLATVFLVSITDVSSS